jgi:dsRNA-specific ribonuclease
MKNSKNRRISAPRITRLRFLGGSILALISLRYLGLLFHKFSRFPIF